MIVALLGSFVRVEAAGTASFRGGTIRTGGGAEAGFSLRMSLADRTWARSPGAAPAFSDTTESDREAERRERDEKFELKKDLGLIALDEVRGEKKWERKKIAKVAILSNMLLPGLGEVYNGRRLKAAIMVGVSTFYMGKAWIEYKRSVIRKVSRDRYEPSSRGWNFQNEWYVFHKESAKDYLWWSGAVWLIGMLDAYVDAHLFDLRAYRPESERSERSGKYLTVSLRF
jgi:hypothetical protein